MITIAMGIFLLFLLLFVIYQLGRRHNYQMVMEFEERFPGKCMICSLHRYGYRECFESNPNPPPHDCIEKPQQEPKP